MSTGSCPPRLCHQDSCSLPRCNWSAYPVRSTSTCSASVPSRGTSATHQSFTTLTAAWFTIHIHSHSVALFCIIFFRALPVCHFVGGRAIPGPHHRGGLEQIPDSAGTSQLHGAGGVLRRIFSTCAQRSDLHLRGSTFSHPCRWMCTPCAVDPMPVATLGGRVGACCGARHTRIVSTASAVGH